jgi:hypothetical protein
MRIGWSSSNRFSSRDGVRSPRSVWILWLCCLRHVTDYESVRGRRAHAPFVPRLVLLQCFSSAAGSPMAARPAAEPGIYVARRGRSPGLNRLLSARFAASRAWWALALACPAAGGQRWHQLHDATGGRNLRAAGGAPRVRVWRSSRGSARDAQGAGGMERDGSLACGRTACQRPASRAGSSA